MQLERFFEDDKRIMVIKTPARMSLSSVFQRAIFFAERYKTLCDEYRLALPDKTLIFENGATIETLDKLHRLLTPEEYHQLEFAVTPFSKADWSAEDKEEVHAFLIDLALITNNVPWFRELTMQLKTKEKGAL